MYKRGFTLIELLVVISIIGLLSSVVLASLSSARNKGKDAAIRSQVLQLRNLMELQFSDTGSYAPLQINLAGGGITGWLSETGIPGQAWACSQIPDPTWSIITGTYMPTVQRICNSLVATITTPPVTATPASNANGYKLHIASTDTTGSKYSIMAYLPSKNVYLCVGSSGISEAPLPVGAMTFQTVFNLPGCRDNP